MNVTLFIFENFSGIGFSIARIRTIVISAALFLVCQGADASHGMHGGDTDPDYILRVWQTEDGLRHPATRAVTQGDAGYLWLATEEELVRFDGARFTEIESKTVAEGPSRWILGLIQSRDGSIWASSSNGGIIRVQGDEPIQHYTVEDGLPDNVILALFEDSRGTIWIGSPGGLTRFRDGKFYTYPTGNGWINQTVRCFAEDSDGNLWIGTPNGLTRRAPNDEFVLYHEGHLLVNNSVMALHVDANDDVWAGTAGGVTHLKKDQTSRHLTMDDGLAHESIRAIHQDRQGVIWVGSHGGLQQIEGDRVVDVTFTNRKSSLSDVSIPDYVYTIYEDREGSLWVGTNIGLNQINVQQFRVVGKPEGLRRDLTTSVYEHSNGDIWVGTWGGGLSRIREGGAITNWGTDDGLSSDHVLALQEDNSGDIWIGTDGDGINRFSDGEFEHYPLAGSLAENTIRAIYQDSRGRVWAGGNAGLFLFKDGSFQSCDSLFGLDLETVKVIVEDEEGSVWIGSDSGLTRLEGEKHTTYTVADGLSSTMVTTVFPDADGVLWVGTVTGGLNRFKEGEPITVYAGKAGLFRERILHLLEDDSGFFWMSSRNGVFRVRKEEMNDFAEGKISLISSTSYGKTDGMRRAQCNGIAQPSGWKGHDSRLWFPTMSGVVVFDPTETRINELPPPVIIERVFVDGQEVSPAETPRVPPGEGRLEVEYTATSFQAPEKVRFRYLLDGFDDDWQDAGGSRKASYNNLRPGHYRFQVAASNNDGVWNETGAEFAFSLAPHFYQTYWFFALCALALISSGSGAYGWRVRQMKHRHQELSTLVDERTQELQQEIQERRDAERHTAAFSHLGQELSLASTQVEAAEIILEIADELIGWDSCGLHAYAPDKDLKTPIVHYDLVDGRRAQLPLEDLSLDISPVMRKTINEGAQLLLREKAAFQKDFSTPFGDRGRASASLMYAPIRNGMKVVGVLSVHSYSLDAYDRGDLKTLQALADYCGGAFERIRTEEALRQSQNLMLHQERLAAIGQLSSGAAHEFNNILTIIQGHSCLLLNNGGMKPDAVSSLREISGSADRAANLTRQLLTFSRKQFMRAEVLDLNKVIGQITSMLSRLLGEDIVFDCEFADELPAVRADPGMVEQIIMNLAVNARDAMPDGGRLLITTRAAEITPHHSHPESRPGPFVVLTVLDTGCGMNSETLSHVFEPFFTTKDVGAGTGLGLASVYGIVKQHHGWIEATSKPGKGTRFTIYLPVTDESAKPSPRDTAVSGSLPPVGDEKMTILVVEDEDGLRNMVKTFLVEMNFLVLEASNGVEALKVWEKHEGTINLLLTDMVLPNGISGRGLTTQLRAKDPNLIVIFTSGYSQEILGQDRLTSEGIVFLPKPYPPEKLLNVIREAMMNAN